MQSKFVLDEKRQSALRAVSDSNMTEEKVSKRPLGHRNMSIGGQISTLNVSEFVKDRLGLSESRDFSLLETSCKA